MRFLAAILLSAFSALGHANVIETVAGGGDPIGTQALISAPGQLFGLAFHGGEWYFSLSDKNVVMKIDSGGTLRLVAGTYGAPSAFAGDGGPAAYARLSSPRHIAFDSLGNLYIADINAARVRKVDAFSGFISTVAGGGSGSASGVPAASVSLSEPEGLAVDASDNLYISERAGHLIRKVNGSGIISTVAGNGLGNALAADGSQATSSSFRNPRGLAVSGNKLFAGLRGYIVQVDLSSGSLSRLAGSGTVGSDGDYGPALSASVDWPVTVSYDAATGIVYFAEDGEGSSPGCVACANKIRDINDGYLDLVIGSGINPRGFDWQGGDLYVAERFNRSLSKFSAPGFAQSHLINGSGNDFCCDGLPASRALMGSISRLALNRGNGHLLMADYDNFRIRDFDPASGLISSFAGNGHYYTEAGNGDGGPATSGSLAYVDGVALDSAGNVYIASSQENRVRVVSAGIITTFAGSGGQASNGDGGPAASASVGYPVDVACNTSTGVVYIAERYNGFIRAVSGGIISTVAGGGTGSFVDGQDALSVNLAGNLGGLTVDPRNGDLYITDQLRNQIYRLDAATHKVFLAAGSGATGDSPDASPALTASLYYPNDTELDLATGDLYISSSGIHRIKRLSGGLLYNVAGNGLQGFSGDNGDPLSASLNYPQGLQIVGGDLYIGDSGNHRLRRIGASQLFTLTPTPSHSYSPTPSPAVTATSSFTVSQTPSPTPTASVTATRSATPSPSFTATPQCSGETDWGCFNTGGTLNGMNTANAAWFGKYTAPSTGVASGLYLYCNVFSGSSANIQVALYDGAASPATRRAVSSTFNVPNPAGDRWVFVPFTSSFSVSSGANYWFAVTSDVNTIQFHYNTGVAGTIYSQFAISPLNLPASAAASSQFTNAFVAYVPLCPIPTATPTSSQSATVTPTWSPTLTCPGSFLSGNTVVEPSSAAISPYNIAQRLTLTASARLRAAQVYVSVAGGASLIAGIYSDSAGAPASLLYSSAAQAASLGWNSIPLGDVNLGPATYWVAVITNSGALQIRYNTGSSGYLSFTAPVYPTMPSSFPAGSASYSFSMNALFCPAGSPTMSPVFTASPSATATPTPSATPSRTASFSATRTASRTRTVTQTLTLSGTISPSFSPSPTKTGTASPSPAGTPTPSFTITQTLSPSPSPSITLTPSPTASPSQTLTATVTLTPTSTVTPTLTPTETPSFTLSPTISDTFTVSPTNTDSFTQTETPTVTDSFTETPSFTASPSVSETSTGTESSTASPTPTGTGTFTPSPTATPTATPTWTPSATATQSPTASPTVTRTATPPFSSTVTPTDTASFTVSPTFSATRSSTRTPTYTASPTATPSGSPTRTVTRSATATASPTATPTGSGTLSATSSASPTASPTRTVTPTATPSSSATLSVSPTDTRTASPTPSWTQTCTPSPSFSPSPTPSATRSSTPSFTASITFTVSKTPSPTMSQTPTYTASSTFSPSPTISLTATISPTHTISPTPSPTPSISPTLGYAQTGGGITGWALGPQPIKRGSDLCLYLPKPLLSSNWLVFNAGLNLVSKNAFGAENNQCIPTAGLAAGVYFATLTVTYADGSTEKKTQKISILP